ncbi:MAG: hypothetical protein QM617_07705 [Comamonas sp.]
MAAAWLLGAVAGAVFLALTPITHESAWRWACILLSMPLSAGWVWCCLKRVPAGFLSWSAARHWRWRAGDSRVPGAPDETDTFGLPCEPRVTMDLQGAILLEMKPGVVPGQPAVRWLWVERPVAMPRAEWLAFRRAVYSPARSEAAMDPLPGPS